MLAKPASLIAIKISAIVAKMRSGPRSQRSRIATGLRILYFWRSRGVIGNAGRIWILDSLYRFHPNFIFIILCRMICRCTLHGFRVASSASSVLPIERTDLSRQWRNRIVIGNENVRVEGLPPDGPGGVPTLGLRSQ